MKTAEEILQTLTLEEKASLCQGASFWFTKEITEKGVPAIMMTDGPHGLRKQTGETDHLGINKSVPATCFPSSAAVCNSWDETLMRQIGAALGQECKQEQVAVLLGPGANLKRSPLCGRNFEYFPRIRISPPIWQKVISKACKARASAPASNTLR